MSTLTVILSPLEWIICGVCWLLQLLLLFHCWLCQLIILPRLCSLQLIIRYSLLLILLILHLLLLLLFGRKLWYHRLISTVHVHLFWEEVIIYRIIQALFLLLPIWLQSCKCILVVLLTLEHLRVWLVPSNVLLQSELLPVRHQPLSHA